MDKTILGKVVGLFLCRLYILEIFYSGGSQVSDRTPWPEKALFPRTPLGQTLSESFG